MSVPHNDDTRESYIARMKETCLKIAEDHFTLGQDFSMWMHLFTWVQCEEIYGNHWDRIKEKNNV